MEPGLGALGCTGGCWHGEGRAGGGEGALEGVGELDSSAGHGFPINPCLLWQRGTACA